MLHSVYYARMVLAFRAWVRFIFVSFLLFVLLYFLSKRYADKTKGLLISLFIFGLLYVYGAIILVNVLYDDSTPTRIHPAIVDKRISQGKHATHYLKLSPWAKHTSAKEFRVSRATYEKYRKGENVTVIIKSGSLHIPWYIIL